MTTATAILNHLYTFETIRGLITLLIAGMNFVMLVYIIRGMRERTAQFERHHRIVATVAPMVGLMRALQEGLSAGGLTPQQRAAIYKAFDAQTALFYEAFGLPAPSTHRRTVAAQPTVD